MMPPPSPAVMERVNNPDRLVTILSLDQLRVWVPQIPYLSPSMRWPIEGFVCCSAKCRYWPLATDRILMADGRSGCEDGVIGRQLVDS